MSSEIGGGVLHLDNISLVEMRRRKNKKKGKKNQQSSGSLTAQGLSSELVCASRGRGSDSCHSRLS